VLAPSPIASATKPNTSDSNEPATKVYPGRIDMTPFNDWLAWYRPRTVDGTAASVAMISNGRQICLSVIRSRIHQPVSRRPGAVTRGSL
jgi:hypothetical protein